VILVRVFGVVVTGPPGAGKTASLLALSDGLVRDEIAHAAIDLDELVWVYPYPTFEERCEQLRAWSVLQRRAGHALFLVAEVVESPEHLRDVLAALGIETHLLVRLQAAPATLRQRIVARESPEWPGLEWLLTESGELAASQPRLAGVHLVLDTESLSATEVAERIRASIPTGR
jgi:broad-specificity NMP kinase